jgi:hypothetical protein
MTKEQKLLLGVGLLGVTAYLLFKKKKKNFLNFTQTELDAKCPRQRNEKGYDPNACCNSNGGYSYYVDYIWSRCLLNKSANQVICENNGDTFNPLNNKCTNSEAHNICDQKGWTFEFVNGVCRENKAVTDCLNLGRIISRDSYDGSVICNMTQAEKDCNANADVWTKASDNTFSCIKSQAHIDCDANGDLWENGICKPSDSHTSCDNNKDNWEDGTCNQSIQHIDCDANGDLWENGICKPSDSHTSCDNNKDNWENGVCNQSVQHRDCISSGGTYSNGICTPKKKNYIPYILGGVVLASVLILKQK